MSSNDIFLLNMYALKPLASCVVAILAVTFVAFFVILIKSRGLWFGSSNFALSLFVELRQALAIKLACAWIKLVTICFFLVSFAQLTAAHYVFFLVPCVIILLINASLIEFFTHLFSMAIQFVGVFGANVLCSYIIQFQMKGAYILMYVLVAMVLVLYSIYIFISEIDFISVRRSVKVESRKENRDNI